MSQAVTAANAKACHRCGISLHDRPRFKDPSGYWCLACHRADKAAHRANHLPCDDCGADIRRGTEWRWGDLRICEVCWQKRHTAELRENLSRQISLQDNAELARRKSAQRRLILIELCVSIPILIALFSRPAELPETPARETPEEQTDPHSPVLASTDLE